MVRSQDKLRLSGGQASRRGQNRGLSGDDQRHETDGQQPTWSESSCTEPGRAAELPGRQRPEPRSRLRLRLLYPLSALQNGKFQVLRGGRAYAATLLVDAHGQPPAIRGSK